MKCKTSPTSDPYAAPLMPITVYDDAVGVA